MSHKVAANLMLPTLLENLHPAVVGQGISLASSAASSTAAAASTSTTAAGGLGTTFLNLLVKELQNQDPTAPMDSTAMVGQMISLNQLDQLIAINQKTSAPTATAAANGMTAAKAVSGSGGLATAASASATNASATTAAVTKPSPSSEHMQLLDLLQGLRGGVHGPATSAPAIFSGFNNTTPLSLDDPALGLPGLNDIPGGK